MANSEDRSYSERLDNLFHVDGRSGLWFLISVNGNQCELRKLNGCNIITCERIDIRRYNFKKDKSEHHLVPRSRDGGRGKFNLRKIPWIKHRAWHILFDTVTPEEIIKYNVIENVKRYIIPKYSMDKEEIIWNHKNGSSRQKYYDSWRLIFGKASIEEAREIVIRRWTPR